LTSIKLNTVTGSSQIGISHGDIGKYAAVGDSNGTITLIEMCNSLYLPQSMERETLVDIFEREKKREDHLKQYRQQAEGRRVKLQKEKEAMERQAEQNLNRDDSAVLKEIEKKFEANVKQAADELFKIYQADEEMTAKLADRMVHPPVYLSSPNHRTSFRRTST
jgi:dynein intermediate chain 2